MTRQVLPSGPSFANDNNLKLLRTLIHKAERRVSITSPYFVPDETILMAIVTAAARGLDVELFVSEIGDQMLVYHAQRSYYEALLRAGVGSTSTGRPRSCTRSTSPLMRRWR